MQYLDLFSGISAPTVAWKPLGWQAVAYAEIERFPSAVLVHHYPAVPNAGDVTKVNWEEWKADLVIAGSPCQSFSNAGKKEGIDDERGQLALEAIRIAERVNARWFIFENVPTVLTADCGRAFARIVAELGKCGYGFAYRILDSSRFGVPQRRRRLFLVGYRGDWRPPARVLLEPVSSAVAPRTFSKSSVAIVPAYLIGRKRSHRRGDCISTAKLCPTLTRKDRHAIVHDGIVRYLTPTECLRLQGFPGNYLDGLGSDNQKYEAIGNSMAVPVIRWLGKRIQKYENATRLKVA